MIDPNAPQADEPILDTDEEDDKDPAEGVADDVETGVDPDAILDEAEDEDDEEPGPDEAS